jgi:hypothetical protein
LAVEFQQTPLAVMALPPSSVTLPPEVAVLVPIEVTAVVVTVGSMFLIQRTEKPCDFQPPEYTPLSELVKLRCQLEVAVDWFIAQ